MIADGNSLSVVCSPDRYGFRPVYRPLPPPHAALFGQDSFPTGLPAQCAPSARELWLQQ